MPHVIGKQFTLHISFRAVSRKIPLKTSLPDIRLGLAHMRFTSVALAFMHRTLAVESVISAVGHKARNAGADSEEIESILGIDQEIAAIHEHVKKCRALFSKPRVVIAEDGTPSIQVEYYGR